MKEVFVYSTSTCPFCKREKAFLDSKGIAYTNYDVSEDEAHAKEMSKKYHAHAVPLLVVKEDEKETVIGPGYSDEEKAKIEEVFGV